jgi:phage portal protein BeeE
MLVNGEYRSLCQTALAFGIPSSTLYNQHQKSKSRKESHISQQLLTLIKESTLENWIYCAAKLEALITLQLVKILALEIQSEQSSKNDEIELSLISD